MGRKGMVTAMPAAPHVWVKLGSFPCLPPYLSWWDCAVTESQNSGIFISEGPVL